MIGKINHVYKYHMITFSDYSIHISTTPRPDIVQPSVDTQAPGNNNVLNKPKNNHYNGNVDVIIPRPSGPNGNSYNTGQKPYIGKLVMNSVEALSPPGGNLLIVPGRYFCGGSYCFMSWCLIFFCAVGALCMLSYL